MLPDAHSLRVFTTVDLAGPLRESMMRIQGLKEDKKKKHFTLPSSSSAVSVSGAAVTPTGERVEVRQTYCLQRFCLEAKAAAAASELTESSARVPSSLQSSWRQLITLLKGSTPSLTDGQMRSVNSK